MDIGGWLQSLGLERYEAAFPTTRSTRTVLPSLTADDLKDLGVGMVGHRRQAARLPLPSCAFTQTRKSRHPRLRHTPKSAQDTAERRQVTVMFSVVGSTALSARMVISAYQKCLAETPVVRAFHTPCARRSAWPAAITPLPRKTIIWPSRLPSPERKTGGTARRNEHGPSLARSGQAE